MGRPPQVVPEKKIRIVQAVIAGEVSVAEASRKEGVSEASIHKWKNEFLEVELTRLPGPDCARVRLPGRRWLTPDRRSTGVASGQRGSGSGNICRPG